MSPGHAVIEWNKEVLALLPERAVWWGRGGTLLIADPHFGKAGAFRAAGIPVPENSHVDDLECLSRILGETAARRLVILGDFFHDRTGRANTMLAALSDWRDRHRPLEIILVLGNHDRRSGSPPAEWSIQCVDGPWEMGPFSCRHEPQLDRGRFVFAGHLHPSHSLPDRIGSGLSGPCFYFAERVAVLPAFGSFTGTHRVDADPSARIFLIGPNAVIEAPRARARGRAPRQPL